MLEFVLQRKNWLAPSLLRRRFSDLHHLNPLRMNRSAGSIFVVPVPPLIRWGLGIARRRVLPLLLAAERSQVEVAPRAPYCLIAAAVDEVSAEHAVAFAEEHVVPVPFVDTEVRVEAVGQGVPRHVPTHPRLQPRDIRLRGAGGEHQRRVAGVQMSEVRYLVSQHGTAATPMFRPPEYPGLEEGAIDDQLRPAVEQIRQAYLALGSVDLVLLVHRQPGHPPARSSHGVPSTGQLLLLDQQLLARSLPLLRQHDRGRLHVLSVHVSLLPRCCCCCWLAASSRGACL